MNTMFLCPEIDPYIILSILGIYEFSEDEGENGGECEGSRVCLRDLEFNSIFIRYLGRLSDMSLVNY